MAGQAYQSGSGARRVPSIRTQSFSVQDFSYLFSLIHFLLPLPLVKRIVRRSSDRLRLLQLVKTKQKQAVSSRLLGLILSSSFSVCALWNHMLTRHYGGKLAFSTRQSWACRPSRNCKMLSKTSSTQNAVRVSTGEIFPQTFPPRA